MQQTGYMLQLYEFGQEVQLNLIVPHTHTGSLQATQKYCSDCGGHKYCVPLESCKIRDSQVNWKLKAKHQGIIKSNLISSLSTCQPSEIRGKQRKTMNGDNDQNNDDDRIDLFCSNDIISELQ